MASIFAERHRGMIQGGISCFDRVAITGPLPDIGIPGQWRLASGISKGLLKDCPRRAEPIRDEIRVQAERLAEETGLSIEVIGI